MSENGFLDHHGQQVHAFALQIANLGFERMTTELLSMLGSEAWQEFKDGLGRYRFLPGEFDYFLSQQGVSREQVMRGVRDVTAKATLAEAMDERRTGEDGYRRRIMEARAANPQRPGRPIEPFGLTEKETKSLVNGTRRDAPGHRQALGERVRRYAEEGTTKRPSERNPLPLAERLRRSALRLGDDDLGDLIDSLKQEQRRRRRDTKKAPGA